MRCREARLRISDSSKEGRSLADDLELLAHLKECPACARQAQAARELQQAFSALSVEDSADAITWSEQIRRVEAQVALDTNRKENPMSALRDQFRRRPRLGYGLAAALVLLLAATVIPLKFDRTVGFEVAVAGVNKDVAFDTYRIQDLLNRLGVTGATVDVTGCEQTCNLKIASLKSPEDAEKIKVAFEELSEGAGVVQVTIELKSIDEQVSGSALKHATTTLIAKVTSDESSNGEMREFVAQKLQGLDGNVFFFCDTTADGMKQIQITASTDDAGGMQWVGAGDGAQFNVNSDDFNWVTAEGDSIQMNMVVMGDSDGEFHGCVIQPDQIVDGHLTTEARAALEAQGYTVEESVDADGATVVKLHKNVDGKDQVIEIKMMTGENGGTVDEAAKDAAEDALPEGYGLAQNYPNPFNPTTQIEFSLPAAERVTIDIYNINGQKVRTLVDQTMGAGSHTVEWNATDDSGAQVASGVYLYRFTAGEVTQTKKMSFVK